MEDKVKDLDSIISETSKGNFTTARNLFKQSVQLILSDSKFYTENTIRNSALNNFINNIEDQRVKVKQSLVTDTRQYEMAFSKMNYLRDQKQLRSYIPKDLEKFQKLFDKQRQLDDIDLNANNQYKNFISGVVSLEDYFDGNKEQQDDINKVYEKIKSSLKICTNDKYVSVVTGYEVNKLGEYITRRNIILDIEKNGEQSKYYQLSVSISILKSEIDTALAKYKYRKYVKSKTYGHEDDLFSILDAIAAVDLELCMKELKELDKLIEPEKMSKEDEKIENEDEKNKNKIIVEKKDPDLKEKKFQDIKKQLKHRARLLGFVVSNAFCDIIDKISTESIDEFKNFVENCQNKFDEYQKEYGYIPANEQALSKLKLKAKQFELGIIKDFYIEAKKQAGKILDQKKKDSNDPKILATEFVLDLVNKHNLNFDIEIDKKTLSEASKLVSHCSEELRLLANGTDKLYKENDFGFENLQSIVKNMASTRKSPDKKLFDPNSAKKFYDLLNKIDNDYGKSILNAINSLKDDKQIEDFLDNILNQKDKAFVSDFFAFAFDDKQEDKKKLEYTKKFFSVIVGQALKNCRTENRESKFLSSAFGKYFNQKINDATKIDELNQTIELLKDLIENGYLSKDPQTSLDVLIENLSNDVSEVIDKNDLVDFFTSAVNSVDKIKNVDGYENRKLLADLKGIFLDDVVHQYKNNDAITHIKSAVKLLKRLDDNDDKGKILEDDFYGLGKVLYTYEQQSIRDKIKENFPLLQAILAYQSHYGWYTFDINEKRDLFKRLVNIKEKGLIKQDKDDLKNYFWSHATKIFKLEAESKKEIDEAQANEFYGFILEESKKDNNTYFQLLVNAIDNLKSNDKKFMFDMLNQDNNFKNIIILKNGTANEQKNAYKSILKFLVKQKLNQKGGFISGAYLKHYEKKIDGSEIINDLQNEIINGVNDVLDDKFQPDSKILMESVNDIMDNDGLSDFWKSCRKEEKNQTEENENEEKKLVITTNNQSMDNKTKDKDIDDKDKILSALSDIFISLLDNQKNDLILTINNQLINTNDKSDLDLVNITKKFVGSLYQADEKNKKEKIIYTWTKKNDQVKKDDTGITSTLNSYYDMLYENKEKLSKTTDTTLRHQIQHFYELNNDQKIKFLQCLKHTKNHQLTNDDLIHINLSFYEMTKNDCDLLFKNPFENLDLIINTSDNKDPSTILSKLFKNWGGVYRKRIDPPSYDFIHYMKENEIRSVIKNIGKQTIEKDRAYFASAVMFCLNNQIDTLKSEYKENCYESIDEIEKKYKKGWKEIIGALKAKGLVSDKQETDFNKRIDDACDLNTFITVCEWILSALAAIFLITLVSGTIRKTLHSPFKTRRTRHLLKSVDGDNGIFSMIRRAISKIPSQENQENQENDKNNISTNNIGNGEKL